MKVLIAVPAKRDMMHIVSRESVLTQRWKDGGQIDTLFLVDGDDKSRWENLCHKLQHARRMALVGGYDALLTVESDIILPDDALEKLWAVDAPVVYGLFVIKHPEHPWSVAVTMTVDKLHLLTIDKPTARVMWGGAIRCEGHGQAVCLIRREVLEAIDFRNSKPETRAQDWYFSFDCQELGFKQMCHLGVVAGHIDYEDGREVIYWPDPEAENLCRKEEW